MPINLFEFEVEARKHLNKNDYDFIAGGANDEITVRRNHDIFETVALRPQYFAGVDHPDLSTTVLGQHIDFPVMSAPAGQHGRAHPDGELATARAVGASGTVMVVSSGSTYTIEEIAAVATGPLWFQQFFFTDPALTVEMADLAKRAGYQAICMTVDFPVPAKRERNIRNRFISSSPPQNYEHLLTPEPGPEGTTKAGSDTSGLVASLKGRATAAALQELVEATSLPVIVKGLLTPEDARIAAAAGAQGIVVSNHGGRQLDTALTTLEALPAIAAAVGDQVEIYLDGGVRRGGDIAKALALGARAVFIGRPIFWGLAVDGENGVHRTLQILRDELEIDLAMCGVDAVTNIDASLVASNSPLMMHFNEFGGRR